MLLRVEDLADADVAVHALAHDGDALRHDILDAAFAAAYQPAQLLGALAELGVGLGPNLGLVGIDLLDDAAVTLQQSVVAAAEDLGHQGSNGQHDGPRDLIGVRPRAGASDANARNGGPGGDVPVQRADWPPVVQQEGRKTALTRAAPEAAAGTGWAGRYREPPGSPAKPASAAGRRPGAAGPATP